MNTETKKTPSQPPQPPFLRVQERRRLRRVHDRFPVTVVQLRGTRGVGRLRGFTRDFDQEGICIEAPAALRPGERVRVRMQLSRAISNFFRGLPCELPARVRAARPGPAGAQGPCALVLEWSEPLPRLVTKAISSYQWKIGLLIALLLLSAVWLKWENLRFFWYAPLLYFYSLTLFTYLVSRFYLSWRHRSPPLTGFTPTVSIVISVRNEQDAIARTVETCYRTEYPAEKREVIVIDDGSTDATPRALEELRKRFPDLKTHAIPPSGKRQGMAEGVRRASGEILVFVDSDTFLFPSALRHIVCGFEDPEVGASAGYTEVENADKNALTGLQEVRYFVSFRLLKSAEGLFSAVNCCPGCLSAYRRKYVLEILEPWLNQKFLGAPATFGDDRSLTNFILRRYRVIYNDLAIASTLVPETWRHYLRQQVRWKKSWLRETLIAARFMHKKHPIAAISFYSASIFSLLSPLIFFRVVYVEVRDQNSLFIYYLAGLLLVGLLQSLYFLHKRPSPHWLLGMLWMASSLLLTGPQTYYAILTMRKNHWGTR